MKRTKSNSIIFSSLGVLFLCGLFYTPTYASSFDEEACPDCGNDNMHVQTAKSFYKQGEAIIISGKVDEVSPNTPLLLQIFRDSNRVYLVQVDVSQDGTYTHSLIADGPYFQTDGKYTVQASYGVTGNVYETSFDFQTTQSNTNPTQIFEVNAGDHGTIDVPYTIHGGALKNIVVNHSILGLIVTVRADNDGTITLDLPRILIDSRTGSDGKSGEDDKYIVYIDGSGAPYQETTIKPESRLITIQFQEGDSNIEIIGTSVLGQYQNSDDDSIVPITVVTDEDHYNDGDMVTIYGEVGERLDGYDVTVQVLASNGNIVTAQAIPVLDDNTFELEISTGGPLWSSTGTYTVKVLYGTATRSAETTFEFGESNQQLPTPTHDIELFVNVDKSEYDLGEVATLTTHISDVSSPKNVAITVTDPFGTVMVSRTLTTDSNGDTSTDFKIAESFKTGTYRIDATSSIDGWTYIDDSEFKVTSQFNQIQIVSTQGTDQQGNPMEFSRGSMGFVKVQVNAQKPIATLITVNVFDSDLTPLGVGSLKTTLNTGQSELILSFMIPQDAVVGTADIYVNALSDWVSAGGIPQTGEFAGQVRIN